MQTYNLILGNNMFGFLLLNFLKLSHVHLKFLDSFKKFSSVLMGIVSENSSCLEYIKRANGISVKSAYTAINPCLHNPP